jgi:hypothetical protein
MRKLAVAIMFGTLSLLAAGCVSVTGASAAESDREIANGLVDSTVKVSRAAIGLLQCAQGDVSCLRTEGSALEPVVQTELRRFEQTLADAEDGCVKEAGEVFLRWLRSYRAASIAAQRADEPVLDEALDRAAALQTETHTRLAGCPKYPGRGATDEALKEVSRNLLPVSRTLTAISNCETYECLSEEGARLEDVTESALKNIGPRIEQLTSTCVKKALRTALDAFRAYNDLAIAAQEGDDKAMTGAYNRGYEAEVHFGERLQACFAR